MAHQERIYSGLRQLEPVEGTPLHAAGPGNLHRHESENHAWEQRMNETWAQVEVHAAVVQNGVNDILRGIDDLKHGAAMDIGNAATFSTAKFASDLLPLRDALEQAVTLQTSDAHALREGIARSLKMLETAFDRNGIVAVAPSPGQQFNPRHHYAVAGLQADWSPCYIVTLEKRGYAVNGCILRRAVVTIALGQKLVQPRF